MADEVRINGNLHSWGSIIFKVDGERFTGFNKISYGDKRERSKGYGMNRDGAPRGRSRGKYTVEPVQVSGHKGSVQALRAALAAKADGVGYGDVVFQIVIEYIETDDTPVVVELQDCVWDGNTSSEEEGPDPLVEDFTCDCMKILRNGLALFDAKRT